MSKVLISNDIDLYFYVNDVKNNHICLILNSIVSRLVNDVINAKSSVQIILNFFIKFIQH